MTQTLKKYNVTFDYNIDGTKKTFNCVVTAQGEQKALDKAIALIPATKVINSEIKETLI